MSVSRESVREFSRFYSHWRDQLTTSEYQDNISQKCRVAAVLLVLSQVKKKNIITHIAKVYVFQTFLCLNLFVQE